MIEIIEGLPDNVVGLVARGRVTAKDYAEILLPAIEKALEWHHRLRLYYEIRTRFPGAAWQEIGLGLGQTPVWERAAIVCDVAWLRHTVTALRLLLPGEVRVFLSSQVPEALAWATQAAPRRRPAAAAPRPATRPAHAFRPAPQYLRQVQ